MRSTVSGQRGGSSRGDRTTTVKAGVRLLVSSLRVRVVVVTLSVLLTLGVVLLARVVGATLLFLLVVFVGK